MKPMQSIKSTILKNSIRYNQRQMLITLMILLRRSRSSSLQYSQPIQTRAHHLLSRGLGRATLSILLHFTIWIMITVKPVSLEKIRVQPRICTSILETIEWIQRKIWRHQQIIWKIILLIIWVSKKSHCQAPTSNGSKWMNTTFIWSNWRSCKRSTTATRCSKSIRTAKKVWLEESRNRNWIILPQFYRETRVKPQCKLRMEMMNRLSIDVSWIWVLNIKRRFHHSRSWWVPVHQWRWIIIQDLIRVISTQK